MLDPFDTGDLAADVRRTVRDTVRAFASPAWEAPYRAMTVAIQDDPDLAAQVLDRIVRPSLDDVRAWLAAAQDRGDVRPDVDLDVAVEVLLAPTFHRWLLRTGPLTDAYADALADAAVGALASAAAGDGSGASRWRLGRRPGAGRAPRAPRPARPKPVTSPTPSGHSGTPGPGGVIVRASGAEMPARSSDGSVLSCAEIAQVVVEVRGRRIDLEVREPHVVGHPLHALVGAQVGEQRRPTPPRCRPNPSPGPPASSFGFSSVSTNTSASTCWVSSRPSPRIRSGTHGSSVGIVTMIGVPWPADCPSSRRPRRVEPGGHEDGAALGVEVEDLGGVRGEEEPVVDGPLPDLVAAALEHRDVERVDLRLVEDLGAPGAVVVASAEQAEALVLLRGATSWARRCSVQSPPRSTLVGTSGSGTIEPTSSPSPVNSNDVT